MFKNKLLRQALDIVEILALAEKSLGKTVTYSIFSLVVFFSEVVTVAQDKFSTPYIKNSS